MLLFALSADLSHDNFAVPTEISRFDLTPMLFVQAAQSSAVDTFTPTSFPTEVPSSEPTSVSFFYADQKM